MFAVGAAIAEVVDGGEDGQSVGFGAGDEVVVGVERVDEFGAGEGKRFECFEFCHPAGEHASNVHEHMFVSRVGERISRPRAAPLESTRAAPRPAPRAAPLSKEFVDGGGPGDAPFVDVGLVVFGEGVEVVEVVDEHPERFGFAFG